jgi:hypothetical protein
MRTLTVLALLFSVQAFACPDLTGNYTCTYSDGSSETVAVSQDTKGEITTYNYNGSTVVADNQTYPVPDDDTIKQATFRAWCASATALKAELIGKYYDRGTLMGDLTLVLELSLEGSNLKQVSSGVLKNSAGERPFSNEIVCTRN